MHGGNVAQSQSMQIIAKLPKKPGLDSGHMVQVRGASVNLHVNLSPSPRGLSARPPDLTLHWFALTCNAMQCVVCPLRHCCRNARVPRHARPKVDMQLNEHEPFWHISLRRRYAKGVGGAVTQSLNKQFGKMTIRTGLNHGFLLRL